MTDDTHWLDPGTDTILSFNANGKFVDDTGKGPQKGFKNDDKFSDWLHAYIERRLVAAGLYQLRIPNESGGAPIYFTSDAVNNPERLLVLICGSGRIHVGVWSVGVCAYHGLRAGSVLPCLDEARRRGMEVIVLNPNHPGSSLLPDKYKIDFGMVNHTLHVFDELLVTNSHPKYVFIIAHSMGGACTSYSIEMFPEWARSKIVAIAYTDGYPEPIGDTDLERWAADRSINWRRSTEPVDSRLPDDPAFQTRSAGTNDHPLTTFKAFPFIWKWFDERAQGAYGAVPLDPTVVGFDAADAPSEPTAQGTAPPAPAPAPEAPAPAPVIAPAPEAPATAPEAPAPVIAPAPEAPATEDSGQPSLD